MIMDEELSHWTLIVASNDEAVLNSTLLASPCIDSRCQVIVKRGFRSAAQAYDAGLAEAQHDTVVFAHQDVYLPEAWLRNLQRSVQHLTHQDSNWGVLGVFGVSATQEFVGHCYSTGLGQMLGGPFPAPVPVSSLDELVLIIRRSSGLSFDKQLPGFHLYATDLCLRAQHIGMHNYVIPAFCIHNSNGLRYYPRSYWHAYMYLRSKWRHRLPVKTCCVTISKWCKPMLAQMVFDIKRRLFAAGPVGTRRTDVKRLDKELHIADNLSLDADSSINGPKGSPKLVGAEK
jgi:hypothetical protein